MRTACKRRKAFGLWGVGFFVCERMDSAAHILASSLDRKFAHCKTRETEVELAICSVMRWGRGHLLWKSLFPQVSVVTVANDEYISIPATLYPGFESCLTSTSLRLFRTSDNWFFSCSYRLLFLAGWGKSAECRLHYLNWQQLAIIVAIGEMTECIWVFCWNFLNLIWLLSPIIWAAGHNCQGSNICKYIYMTTTHFQMHM